MKQPLSKVLRRLNKPTPQDYGVAVKKENPADTSSASIVVKGPGRKVFTADAREKTLPAAYAVTMTLSDFPGKNLVQEGVLPEVTY